MAWLLGFSTGSCPGTALFVVFDAVLAFGSFARTFVASPDALHGRRRRWRRCAVLTPQMLLYQGIVWKDVLFADAGVAGFVCLALAAALWLRPRLRFGLIAGGIAFLVLAALARQNGVLMLLAGACGAWLDRGDTRAGTARGCGNANMASAGLLGALGVNRGESRARSTRGVTTARGPATQIERLAGL